MHLPSFAKTQTLTLSHVGISNIPEMRDFGASPDGVSTEEQEFLVEIKNRSLPNKSELAKLEQEEVEAKLMTAQTPLTQVSIVSRYLHFDCLFI